MKKIRWVIAHEPIELFVRAAQDFAAEVNAKTDGGFDIEVLSLTDYSEKYHGGRKISKHEVLGLMESGQIEMSQMYVTTLGHHCFDLFALDLPFVFRDHDHATRVLDGQIGQDLLHRLAARTPFKGLAFTYSGGFRCIPSNKPIRSVEDFAGLKIRTSSSPVAQALFAHLGAEPVGIDLEKMNDAADEGLIDAGESTHVRIFPLAQDKSFEYVSDTAHSLFLTCMLTSKQFWNGLTEDEKAILQAAASRVATGEREYAVQMVEEVRATLGDRVVYLSDEEQGKLKVAATEATHEFRTQFKDIVAQIDQA